ncbi:glycosyltransferase family 4 protein [Thermodesulfobacteriota bacterium]
MYNRYKSLIKSLIRNIPASFSLKPYSDLLFISEGVNWVTSWEVRELAGIIKKLGIHSRFSGPSPIGLPRQSIFLASRYFVLAHPRRYLLGGNRIAFPYYHGYPESGDPIFVECYNNLMRFHRRISRIQVTHSRMHDLILSTGIDPTKVFLIPIGINMELFQKQTPETRKAMREKYCIPQHAVVIGSFQKDGNGWGEGYNPKMIKGPDVFLKTIRILKDSIPELFILLSGPARGYVKKGLEDIKVPYKHIFMKDYPMISELYQCLDLYIIPSRDEGGPKAVLESMASGIPLVTTRVGQAMDLVHHGENGWMVDVEDTEGLAYWTEKALTDTTTQQKLLLKGFKTTQSNSYDSQLRLWKDFFQGFIERY